MRKVLLKKILRSVKVVLTASCIAELKKEKELVKTV